ncbi:MAG TPA: G1 family glutamic endopeptidase [Myxococcales bacterium]|nr:G1 family glutamic endopeptidase [Myxococcales bacterium]
MRTHLTPFIVLLAAACAGTAGNDADGQDLAPAVVGASPEAHLSHTLPRGGSSTLSFRTLKNATCLLRPASEAPGAAEHLKLYADDDGIARLGLTDTGGNLDKLDMAVDCADDAGRVMTHALHLATADGVRGQAPAAFNHAGKVKLAAPARDPAALSEAEIHAAGYPPRPDAASAPKQYANWIKLVNSGATVITPHAVKDPSRVHGPVTSNANGSSTNWSGYVISTPGSAPQYGEIFGAWRVPQVYSPGGFWSSTYSSFWVGIDGWGTPDVVQAGTDENAYNYFWVAFHSYGAWTEWYPYSSVSISNFSVNPGDNIYCWVWVDTSAGAWAPNGNVGWFYVWNTTQNVASGYLSTVAPSGTVFNGHQAEWVMERPQVGGSITQLANYSWAQIYDAWAYDYAYKTHYYQSDSSWNLTMVNGNDVLSTVAPADSMTMNFTWHNYQ